MDLLRESKKVRKYKAQTRSRTQEKEIAKKISGRITVGSGNKNEKGDVRKKGIARIECKTTQHKSFSVTLEMIDKLEDAATPAGELPVLVVEFLDKNGRKIKDVCVVPSFYLEGINNAG